MSFDQEGVVGHRVLTKKAHSDLGVSCLKKGAYFRRTPGNPPPKGQNFHSHTLHRNFWANLAFFLPKTYPKCNFGQFLGRFWVEIIFAQKVSKMKFRTISRKILGGNSFRPSASHRAEKSGRTSENVFSMREGGGVVGHRRWT